MSTLRPIDGYEKEENRLGNLSERQRNIIFSRYRLGIVVFVCTLILSALSYLYLFVSWQNKSYTGFLITIVYGPGIIIVSALYARKNWNILHKGKVKKETGNIQKMKRVYRRVIIYYWLMVNKIRIPVSENDFFSIKEEIGTVYYLTTKNSQREFLFIDSQVENTSLTKSSI